ncbi:hypothetical protein CPT_Maine_222 [Staphylococcus phage Maine]|nr:hypothetical protein CPT_Maine_222 [Staphylococcus phage Maine]
MKLYLDKNIVEGTPEEMVEYRRLLEKEELSEQEIDADSFVRLIEKNKEPGEDKPTFQGVLGSIKVDKSSIESPTPTTDEEDKPSLAELVYLLSELVYDDLTEEERNDKKLKAFEMAIEAKRSILNK